jgi:hypothetical protein
MTLPFSVPGLVIRSVHYVILPQGSRYIVSSRGYALKTGKPEC